MQITYIIHELLPNQGMQRNKSQRMTNENWSDCNSKSVFHLSSALFSVPFLTLNPGLFGSTNDCIVFFEYNHILISTCFGLSSTCSNHINYFPRVSLISANFKFTQIYPFLLHLSYSSHQSYMLTFWFKHTDFSMFLHCPTFSPKGMSCCFNVSFCL